MVKSAVTALVCVFSVISQANSEMLRERGTLTVIEENDLFYGPDRHYSQGLLLNYMSGDKARNCPLHRVTDAVRITGRGPDGERREPKVRCGFGIGQSIFTPRDITASEPLPGERPYAGWLYLNLMYVREDQGVQDTAQLNIGVVGPHAFGEEVQNGWHEFVLHIPKLQGWDNQLRDEPGLALTVERRWRCHAQNSACSLGLFKGTFLEDYVELSPHVGVSLGNVQTHGAVGLTARIGLNLDGDYGPPRIRPALAGSSYFTQADDHVVNLPILGGVSFYAFAGVEARAVARNIFLDGNTFRSSLSVDKKWFVGDLQAGAVMQAGRFQFGYTHVMRTKEYFGQPDRDRFGAITVQFKL